MWSEAQSYCHKSRLLGSHLMKHSTVKHLTSHGQTSLSRLNCMAQVVKSRLMARLDSPIFDLFRGHGWVLSYHAFEDKLGSVILSEMTINPKDYRWITRKFRSGSTYVHCLFNTDKRESYFPASVYAWSDEAELKQIWNSWFKLMELTTKTYRL